MTTLGLMNSSRLLLGLEGELILGPDPLLHPSLFAAVLSLASSSFIQDGQSLFSASFCSSLCPALPRWFSSGGAAISLDFLSPSHFLTCLAPQPLSFPSPRALLIPTAIPSSQHCSGLIEPP